MEAFALFRHVLRPWSGLQKCAVGIWRKVTCRGARHARANQFLILGNFGNPTRERGTGSRLIVPRLLLRFGLPKESSSTLLRLFMPMRYNAASKILYRSDRGALMLRHILAVSFLLAWIAPPLHACTTVVVSGRATIDGRPLLWKNRDTWQRQNEVLYDQSGQYPFVGIVNAEATKRVWMGMNAAGFCIENSLSKDLGQRGANGMGNGTIIRMALETCRTVADFEQLLKSTNQKGRSTTGNFGVIDNHGGAMLFEVGPDTYRRFNVNDPVVAPDGYLVRANTSMSGADTTEVTSLESGYSGKRYCRARDLCQSQIDRGQKIDVQFLLQTVARDVLDLDPSKQTASTTRTLSRNTSVSSVVFQGTLPGESPSSTTMWTILGEPLFSVAVPVWVGPGKIAKELNGDGKSAVCDRSIELRDLNYQQHTERRTERVYTAQLPKISQVLLSIENESLSTTQQQLQAWRNGPSIEQQWQLHQQTATAALQGLSKLCQVTTRQGGNGSRQQKIHVDFGFNGSNGTKLAEAKSTGSAAIWDGGLTASTIKDGSFRIRRNNRSPINRYVDLVPDVRVKSNAQGDPKSHRGWIVVELAGWNLRGETQNESFRCGFSSRSEGHLHTAGIELKRVGENSVAISGVAFGDGATNITTDRRWPAKQETPITLVLELDKVDGNNGESDAGGSYRVFVKSKGDNGFQQLGGKGKVRRLRNGNHMHLRSEGFFGATNEFLDIDRIYYTTTQPNNG